MGEDSNPHQKAKGEFEDICFKKELSPSLLVLWDYRKREY